VPGTYSGNRLKKFVKHKGFYKPAESKEESEGETEKEVENKAGEREEAEVEPMDFEVRVPTLIPVQQSKYIQYKEDDKGNIL
jgi:hypothetical protein